MKAKRIAGYLLVGILCLGTVGCANSVINENGDSTENADVVPESADNADGSENASGATADKGAKTDTNTSMDVAENETADGDIIVSFAGISATLPKEWKGRYVLVENEDGTGFSIMQKASHEIEEYLGMIFYVHASTEPDVDVPGAEIIAYSKELAYYFGTPTDVSFYYEDESVSDDYVDMFSYINQVRASIEIAGDDICMYGSEYVYPMSEYYPLTENMLLNMSEKELWLARNEIYARHGYHFKNYFLQSYFEKYAWYQDRGNEFSENEFSQIEKDNVDLFKKMEDKAAAKSEYPLEKNVGSKVSIDLSGNGKNNTVLYQIKQDSNGWDKGYLTVDGKEHDLEAEFDLYMDCPEDKHFYITDISPFFDGLEIAIADYGPSDDPVTHFFTYDENEGLHYIGSVPGFPMKQMGIFNGFTEGGVTGYSRTMTIDVHEHLVYYWYDHDAGELVLQQGDDYHVDLPRTHVLLSDLTLHYSMDKDSDTFTLPKGCKTFFKECMNDEWVLVHGDGVDGYVHYKRGDGMYPDLDEMGVCADQVFDNLLIYD